MSYYKYVNDLDLRINKVRVNSNDLQPCGGLITILILWVSFIWQT